MQDQYAGDIGDYVKLAMLRALSPGRRLGVGWWLCPDEGPEGDGRHVSYLRAPHVWRHLDPELFDALEAIVSSGRRTVAALEAAEVLADTVYHSEMLPVGLRPEDRRSGRLGWFSRCCSVLDGSDLAFLDPDNGLEPGRFSLGAKRARKSVSLEELAALRRPGRTMIVYHHQTRRAGGHPEELQYWADRLRSLGYGRIDVIRATAYSVRAFFLLDADDVMRERAANFSRNWIGRVCWHLDPDLVLSRAN